MGTMSQPELAVNMTAEAAVEVRKFMEMEKVSPEVGGLRVSVQPGGCSGFKYSLLIEDKPAEDDTVVMLEGYKVFVDPFSMQYISGVTIDYVTSMQGSGFTFKNPNSTGGCGCGTEASTRPANQRRWWCTCKTLARPFLRAVCQCLGMCGLRCGAARPVRPVVSKAWRGCPCPRPSGPDSLQF